MARKTIDDSNISHTWKKAEDNDCGEGPEQVEVTPDWYQNNGTPTCFCGQDMEYSHTEINDTDEEFEEGTPA